MDILNSLGVLAGSSWASGINLYLTIASLGVAQRMHWLTLPGDMNVLANPLVIIVAVVLYAVEFVADKIPFVDSAWDSVHTFIRPAGSALMGYMSAAHLGLEAQIPLALVTGAVALNSHLTKATTRVAINTTAPIPGVGAAASVGEDGAVLGVMYLIIKHPIIAAFVVILFILFSIWLLRKLFRFLKKVLSFIFRSESKPSAGPAGS